jgi:hypothetical protein
MNTLGDRSIAGQGPVGGGRGNKKYLLGKTID